MICASLCGDFQLAYQLPWTLLCSQPLCGGCGQCPSSASNCSDRCDAVNSPVIGQGIPWSTLCQETWNSSADGEEWRCFGCHACVSSLPPPSSPPPETCHAYCATMADVAMNGANAIPWSTSCQTTWSSTASGAAFFCYDCPQCASISPPYSPPPPSPSSPPPETCHAYCAGVVDVFLNGDNAIPWSTICQETWSSSAGGGGWRCYGCEECTAPPTTAPPAPPSPSSPCLPFCEGRSVDWWRKCRWPGCSGCDSCHDATPPSSMCLPHCLVNPTPWSRKCKWPGCSGCAGC